MTSDAHLNELGHSLKARRGALSPRTVGLPDRCGRRRVTGLRREEVALLAGISTDYYTRLEQGRVQPSAPVLATLARVLHLDDGERDHLFQLAGRQTVRPRREAAQQAQPQLRRLLDDLTATPGVVIGRRMDILAWNPPAAALLTDFAKVPPNKRNCVRILFTDPLMRTGGPSPATRWLGCACWRPGTRATRDCPGWSVNFPCWTRTSRSGGPTVTCRRKMAALLWGRCRCQLSGAFRSSRSSSHWGPAPRS